MKKDLLLQRSLMPVDRLTTGTDSLTIKNARGLLGVKAYGKCEQNGTPTPSSPVDIVCNNGTIKARHQSGLPLGYTLLNSVTNANGDYLDTGIIADVDDMEFDIVVKINNSSVVSWYILQSRNNSSAPSYGISGSASGNTFIGAFSGTNVNAGTTIVRKNNHIYHVNSKCKNGTIILIVEDLTDNTSITNTGTYTFATAPTNIGLFSNLTGGTVSNGNTSVISAYIKKSGVKVLDYIPSSQGTTAGFYDKITGTFKGATGGSFIAGNEVNDPIEIYTDGLQETINVHGKNLFDPSFMDNSTYETVVVNGGTATTTNLLQVGDYKDTQDIINGIVTRRVGIKILDGTEGWSDQISSKGRVFIKLITIDCFKPENRYTDYYVTHFKTGTSIANTFLTGSGLFFVVQNGITTLTDWTNWLGQQYIAGTPVIIVYPLATETTESVIPQTLAIQSGTNTFEITQASLDNLEIEVKYRGIK